MVKIYIKKIKVNDSSAVVELSLIILWFTWEKQTLPHMNTPVQTENTNAKPSVP